MGFLYDNFISHAFTYALNFIYSIVSSYGWSIFILTTLFRLVMLPLDIKTKKNTKKQQALQPMVNAINKKYANDKEMQSKKTMELYKQQSFNPMAGCLPLLIQMPIFFAFFGALRSIANDQISTMFIDAQNGKELVFESFLWIKNVWQPDTFWADVIPQLKQLTQYPFFKEMPVETFDVVMAPYMKLYEGSTNGLFILPLLAGGMSYFQSKLAMPAQSAAPVDPGKSKNPLSGKTMQYIMPFFSIFICISSSAAFALYWATSNIVSVANYVVMNKVFKNKEQHIIEMELEEPKSRKMERKLPKL